MTSVVKAWVGDLLSFKQQTVLLSALRGCDGKPKEDVSKILTRKLRGEILLSADTVSKSTPGTFMGAPDDMATAANKFVANLDHYPVHWLMHFAHAVEIVGYYHPDPTTAKWWLSLYEAILAALHVSPESKAQNEERLKDGRQERNDPKLSKPLMRTPSGELMRDAAVRRPADYSKLTPKSQWAVDKELGILDWDGR